MKHLRNDTNPNGSTAEYDFNFISYNLARKINGLNEGFLKVVTGEFKYKDLFLRFPI